MRPIRIPATGTQTGVGSSAVIPVDYMQAPVSISFGCVVTGTINYTVQHTFDDIYDASITPVWFDHPYVVAQTTSKDGNYAYAPRAIRIKINSGTGTIYTNLIQGGQT